MSYSWFITEQRLNPGSLNSSFVPLHCVTQSIQKNHNLDKRTWYLVIDMGEEYLIMQRIIIIRDFLFIPYVTALHVLRNKREEKRESFILSFDVFFQVEL
jgi:hypothetical protein